MSDRAWFRSGTTGQHSGVPRKALIPPKKAELKRFGARVRQLRQQHRPKPLSQEELAHRAKIGRSYMSGIERGVRNCSVLHVLKIAAALGVEPSELLD